MFSKIEISKQKERAGERDIRNRRHENRTRERRFEPSRSFREERKIYGRLNENKETGSDVTCWFARTSAVYSFWLAGERQTGCNLSRRPSIQDGGVTPRDKHRHKKTDIHAQETTTTNISFITKTIMK